MFKYFIAIKLLGFVFVINLQSQQIYKPIYGDPLNEPWRWTRFDELIGKGVKCISETADRKIIFGLNKGAILYNGISWHEQNSSNGLIDESVNHLALSDENLMYAGTDKGLYEFDGTRWTKIFPLEDYNNDIQSINCLIKTNGGGIAACIGDENSKGLLFYKKGKYEILASQKTVDNLKIPNKTKFHILPESLCIEGIFHIENTFQDSKGRYWIWESKGGSEGNVFYLKKSGDKIKYSKLFTEEDGITKGKKTKFEEDGNGNIWMINSTFHKGLSIFNGQSWQQTTLKGENSFLSINYANDAVWIGGFGILYAFKNGKWLIYKKPATPIPTSKIFVFFDSHGYLWVSGILGEVKRIDYSGTRWNTLKALNYHCEDNAGNMWFISVDNKVVIKKPNNWYAFDYTNGLPDAPVRITCTKNGTICVAGSYKEQACLSFFDGTKWTRQIFPELSWGIDNRAVFIDKSDNLWASASVNNYPERGHKGGVIKIKNPGKENQETTHYTGDEISLSAVYGFAQSTDNTIWACGKHLIKYKNNKWGKFTEINHLNQFINSIGNSPNGDIWIGSRRFGIFHFSNNQWKIYNADSCISDNTIISILPIGDNNVWVATNSDFSRYDGKSWANNLFIENLTLSQEEGDLQFQKNGIIWINRSSRNWKRRAIHNNLIEKVDKEYFSTIAFKTNQLAPETEITVYSKEVSANGNTYIEWNGLDAWRDTPSSKLQYSYRINKGEWSNFNTRTNKTFLNLKNGDYLFEVRARDIDLNVDLSPAQVQFIVLPPVWKQLWFILLISSLVTVIFFYQFITLVQKKNLKNLNTDLTQQREEISRKNILLEEQKEQILQQTINEKEQSQSKLRFFTNISHEFRTPLTVITGIIESLSKNILISRPEYSIEQFKTIKRNANRLLRLINQLMDFRKIDNNMVKLSVSEIDVIKCIQDICHSFKTFAEKYKIQLTFECEQKQFNGWLDADKLDKIVVNLLSNAIKATPEKGQIRVFLTKKTLNDINHIELIVEDTGIGIPDGKMELIFERFFQIDSRSMDSSIGSGVGLSIVRSYVNLHHGSIEVVSTQDIGLQLFRGYSTRFIVLLPIDKLSYKLNEIFEEHNEIKNSIGKTLLLENSYEGELNLNYQKELPEKRKTQHILVVEDNTDLRRVMADSLKKHYTVIEARNGREGYEFTLSYLPDLIISDIMMPEMSGSELCHKIKNDLKTSHIPVILLTAFANREGEIEGFQKGADDYITKPFDFEILLARIKNILFLRHTLRQKFRNKEVLQPDEEKVLSMDTAFLKKIKSILEKNYSNPQFNVEELSSQIGISSRHLLHKLKNLVGISPVEYIKIFRLEKAAYLLSGKKGNVSDIAYDTGFNDTSYFGKCFSKHFGMSPSEYLKDHTHVDL
jgi:signal transduction histidine kinase/AraC-like DNA-binding protein/ligand-binding sensor domain-containing protein